MAGKYAKDLIGTGENILVVEKDPTTRGLYFEILSVNGYNVQLAENSIQAIALYEKYHTKYDLILTDLQFPNLMEFISCVLDRNPNAKALFTSSSYMKAKFMNVDTFRVIKKPLDIVELFQVIRFQLKSERTSEVEI